MRLAALREVARRSDDNPADGRSERHRDHLERHRIPKADPGVEALRNDVDQPTFGNEIDLHIGELLQERQNHGGVYELGSGLRRVDAQDSGRLVAKFVRVLHRVRDLAQRGTNALEETLAGLGERDAASGAVKKADAQSIFECGNRVAHRRRRHAQLCGRAPEASVGRNRNDAVQLDERGPAGLCNPVHHCMQYYTTNQVNRARLGSSSEVEMKKYEGKRVVITGGTNGIGLTTAKLLLAEGARVLVTGHTEATLAVARKELGPGAIVIGSDTTSLQDIEALAARVRS